MDGRMRSLDPSLGVGGARAVDPLAGAAAREMMRLRSKATLASLPRGRRDGGGTSPSPAWFPGFGRGE
jgi:hypothetical protein